LGNERTFEVLLLEFRRVGVDPDTFSAMLALRPEEALRALKALPDNAGTSAFVARLRAASQDAPVATGKPPRRAARGRDKSA